MSMNTTASGPGHVHARGMAAVRAFIARWSYAWDSGVLFFGQGLAAFLFLLFHMLIGRRMEGEHYAEFVALIGLLNVLNVPAGVMQMTMARYVAECMQADTESAWLSLVRAGMRAVTRWGLLALVGWFLLAPALRAGLRASGVAGLGMVGVIAFVFLYTPILGGALQGSRRFGWFALSGIGVAVSRLALAGIVLFIHRGVAAMLGVVATSFAIGLIIAYWPLRASRGAAGAAPVAPAQDVHRYFWGVLVGQGALFLLMNADLILSPRLFAGETLAAYGKAATLSRIVFLLPLPMITAMFPRAVTSDRPWIVLAPLGATLGISLAAAAALSLFPALPMSLMYGVSDPIYLALVRRYVWAAIPLALLNTLSPYIWARRNVVHTLWLVPVTLGYVVMAYGFTRTPDQLISLLGVAGTIALLLLLWMTRRTFSPQKRMAATPRLR